MAVRRRAGDLAPLSTLFAWRFEGSDRLITDRPPIHTHRAFRVRTGPSCACRHSGHSDSPWVWAVSKAGISVQSEAEWIGAVADLRKTPSSCSTDSPPDLSLNSRSLNLRADRRRWHPQRSGARSLDRGTLMIYLDLMATCAGAV